MSLRDYSGNGDRLPARNPWVFIAGVLVMLAILAGRLFALQVFDYHLYLNKSEDYRIKQVIVEAPRGFIYDRNGELLATNRMSYEVTIDPFARDRFDETIPRLASLVPELPDLIGVPRNALADTINALTRITRNPATIIRDADFRTISVIEEHSLELPGVGCTIGQRRYYPHGSLAAHILGYMGKLSRDEADRLEEEGYDRNQWIGKYGVERYYESELKGDNGVKFLEKNYLNRFLGTISDYQPVEPVPGNDITLTIDYRLQMVAETAFGDSIRGALVAIDPRNGEILAMASAPTFDPNGFASIMTSDQYAALMNDPQNPLYNRAIQGTYPPGSPFKVITALAGLKNGIDENTHFQPCDGTYYFGRVYHCWIYDTGGAHGSLDMIGAITQSCNIYMYQLGRKVGLDNWSEVCGEMGFGRPTGIDLYGEVAGNLPSPEFYEKNNITWSPGMILNLSIGQGENDVTPLQLAHYTGIIATGGLVARPHLVRGHEEITRIEDIPPHAFDVVREGMYGVVNAPQGTARSARIEGYTIAGKTGTAQNPHGEAHKLFIAFAPYENPTIAIACVAENADREGVTSLAVQFGKRVLTEYFRLYPPPVEETESNETTNY